MAKAVSQDAYGRHRLHTAVAWCVAAVGCVVFAALGYAVLMASAGIPSTRDTGRSDQTSAMTAVTVSCLLIPLAIVWYASRIAVRSDRHDGAEYAGAFALAASAAASVGPPAAMVVELGSRRNALEFAVFVSAAVAVVAAAYIQYRAESRMTVTLARLLIVAAVAVAAGVVLVAAFAVPVPVVAAVCSLLGVWYMHAQANVILRVPDRYLLEWRRYMSQKWTVRGAVPEDSRPLTEGDIAEDMGVFSAEYTYGLVVGHLAVAAGYAVMCLTLPERPGVLVTIGFAAYSVLLPCYLLLRPRTANGVFERMLMRAVGVAIPTMGIACVASHDAWRWLTTYLVLALLAVGLAVAASTLVLAGGFRSIMLSRMGDWIAASSLALMGPAALLASDAMDMIRGFMS